MGTNKSRKDMRAMVSLVARYRSPTTFEYASEECADVSVGGMFIKSATPAAAGTLLKLECDPDEQETDPNARIRGVARVVWLRREDNENGPSGMGVKFVKLEPGSRELIEHMVRRLSEAGVHARPINSAAPEGLGGPSLQHAVHAQADLSDVPATSPVLLHGADDREPSAPHEPTNAEAATLAAAIADRTPPWPSEPPASASGWQGAEGRTASVPPREDVAPRPSSRPASGSLRPTAPKTPSRFGLRGWLIVATLVLIAVVIVDHRSVGDSERETGSLEPAAPQAQAAAEPAAAEPVAAPTPTPVAVQEPTQEPSEPAPTEAAVNAPPANSAREPAAVDAPQPTAAAATGQSSYAIDFVSRPNGASVTIDEDTHLVTPATLDLATAPTRIKITARKTGYKSSSIWLELNRKDFELKDGVQRRRVYLTLKPQEADEQAEPR